MHYCKYGKTLQFLTLNIQSVQKLNNLEYKHISTLESLLYSQCESNYLFSFYNSTTSFLEIIWNMGLLNYFRIEIKIVKNSTVQNFE